MTLSKKQQVFIEHYLVCWNATEAAKKAGYSAKSAYSIGSENLKKPEISARIRARLDELKMGADEVLLRLTEMGRANMRDFVDIDADGRGFINLTKAAKKGKLHLIKEIEHVVETQTVNEMTTVRDSMKLKLHDQMAALQLIGKHHALFTDRVKVDDWRSQAIDDIRAGRIDFEALSAAFEPALAEELFTLAGVPITR